MAAPETGLGFSVKYGDDFVTMTTLANILDITTPEADVKVASAAALDDAAKRTLNKPGSCDEGSLEVEMIHVDATYTALHGLLRTEKSWQATFPDGAKIQFTGFLAKLSTHITADDFMKIKFSVKVTNTVTLA